MLRKFMNDKKQKWYITAALAVAVILVAAGTFALFSGRVDADSEEFRQYAEKVYALRVSDLTDTAAVAALLEAMDLEATAGEYSVEIAPESDVYTLSLSIGKSVKQENKNAFDGKMGKKAQQLLALIPQLGKVEWSYDLRSDGTEKNAEEQATESVDTTAAGELLGKDIREFGASRKQFEALLELQAGEEG